VPVTVAGPAVPRVSAARRPRGSSVAAARVADRRLLGRA